MTALDRALQAPAGPAPYWRDRVTDFIDNAHAEGVHTLPTQLLLDSMPNLSDFPAGVTAVRTEAQGIIIWAEGRGVAVYDHAAPTLLSGLPLNQIERAVMVARLRAIADLLEQNGPAE